MPHTERRRHCFLDYVDGLPTGGFRLARGRQTLLTALHDVGVCPRLSHAVAEDDSTKRDECTWLVDLSNHNIRLHCGRAGSPRRFADDTKKVHTHDDARVL